MQEYSRILIEEYCEKHNLNLEATYEVTSSRITKKLVLNDVGIGYTTSENLKEIAELRIKNPDSSYEELGKMLTKPIGKSGGNHRLQRLHEIAEELRR